MPGKKVKTFEKVLLCPSTIISIIGVNNYYLGESNEKNELFARVLNKTDHKIKENK